MLNLTRKHNYKSVCNAWRSKYKKKNDISCIFVFVSIACFFVRNALTKQRLCAQCGCRPITLQPAQQKTERLVCQDSLTSDMFPVAKASCAPKFYKSMYWCLIRSFLVRIRIAKRLTNGSKGFQWEVMYVLFGNTPRWHLNNLCATGVSNGLAARVTLTPVPLWSLRKSITRAKAAESDCFGAPF
jgi:hypothetical protein